MPSADLKKLIKKRGTINAQLTRFKEFLEDQANINSPQIKERLIKCEGLWETFDSIQSEIESLDESDTQVVERIAFEDRFYDIISKAKQINLCTMTKAQDLQQNNLDTCTSAQCSIKLPTIELPSFSGKYEEWLPFYDTFKSLIHSNDNLSAIQKFHYLKSAVKGDATSTIQTLEVSTDNYQIAWELLRDRFENKRLIVHNYVKELFDIHPINKESLTALRKLLDLIRKNLRALKSLGQPVDSWDTLLIYLLSAKLDTVSKREWEKTNISNELPTMTSFLKFLSERCQLLETLETKHTHLNKSQFIDNKTYFGNKRTGINTFVNANRNPDQTKLCVFCNHAHFLFNCNKFLNLPIASRIAEVKRLRLCLNCLRANHLIQSCVSRGCRKCGKKHNTLLHLPEIQNTNKSSILPVSLNEEQRTTLKDTVINSSKDVNESEHISVSHCAYDKIKSEVLLSTASVYIYDKFGQEHEARVLLDSASQSNFITSELAKKLKLPTRMVNIPVISINQNFTRLKHKVSTTIKSKINDFNFEATFLVIDEISNRLPVTTVDIRQLKIPENITLADSKFNVPCKIDLLLGATIFYELLCSGQIKTEKRQPILQRTQLGWVISGEIPCINSTRKQGHPNAINSRDDYDKIAETHCNFITNSQIQEQLEKFWLIEECPRQVKYTKEEEQCEEHFKSTFKRSQTNRFIVKLPLRHNFEQLLGDTRDLAIRRFMTMERKLLRDSHLRSSYTEFLKEYIELGHMTPVNPLAECNKTIYYLPHHSVIKESSFTTRCRVVFDASAKSSTNVSLNDVLLVGPNIQEDIFSITLRFRTHPIVFTSDIAKMYRQIQVDEDQRDLQRIVWRESAELPLIHYRLNTVTYGTASASFLATRCLKQLALENERLFPQAATIIRRDFYMDDLLTGADSVEQATELIQEISNILDSSGFPLRKWRSNETAIFSHMSQEAQNSDQFIIKDNQESKTLGTVWRPFEDVFQYVAKRKNQFIITKRVILSVVSQIFDPLGLLGPIIIKAKIILQKLWSYKLDWDEEIPAELSSQFSLFYNDILAINKIKIIRHIVIATPTNIQLHCFCDASLVAYGACIYIRSQNAKGDVAVRLACAKSRIAPLKTLSLPRLELCGAVLCVQLAKKALKSLNLTINNVYYWTDSTIAIAWIATEPSKLKTFVSNRVAQIQSQSTIDQWGHVASENNPADLLSRGVNPSQLQCIDLWWNGPQYLLANKAYWPKSKNHETEIPEIKQSAVVCNLTKTEIVEFDIIERYSSFLKLIHVIAYCLRFKHNSLSNTRKPTIQLTPQEVDGSMQVILKLVQKQYFAAEIECMRKGIPVSKGSKLLTLDPFLDERGLIRVGGRLLNSELKFDQKFPIVLPAKSHFTKLLILYEHERNLHAGPQATLNIVRSQYWPLNGRQIVRSVIHRCYVCFRANPPSYQPKMGDLPATRIKPARVFSICAVDYAGPFLIKDGKLRNRKFIKSYICIFICFVSKAIHIELVTDLSTDSFLNALKRFFARRGVCSQIYSDNGSNFHGAEKYLQEFINMPEDPLIKKYLLSLKIQWKFSPSRSPHFNGLVESAVRLTKYHLKRVAQNMAFTYEEFYTLITQVESILNSRPLTPLTNDPSDLQALTPGHFLIGEPLTPIPEAVQPEIKGHLLSRYQHLKLIIQHFWKRWNQDYLHNLQQRSKWHTDRGTKIKVGSLVVLREDNVHPRYWSLGRITSTFKGTDDIVRVVSVKTSTGEVRRAVAKISVLPEMCDYNE